MHRNLICLCASLFLLPSLAAQQCPTQAPIPLQSILPSGDPLAAQDLSFDVTFATDALHYMQSADPAIADRIARSAAISHLLNHARNFDYDVPKDSPQALAASLLKPRSDQASRSAVCAKSVHYFCATMLSDPHWVAEALAYLPADFQFHGTLFLTYGYDIGVAFAPNASLNCTHPHFGDHRQELLYYAIHELHHVGFMEYQKPPRLTDLKSCADLLKLVEYSTQMEGMAVLAALHRRREDNALAGDPDYVAFLDQKRMQSDLVSYFKDYNYLKNRGTQPANADAWAVIHRMSSGERLWYRVGAYIAQRIEAAKGRAALVELVKQGPSKFLATYESLRPQTSRSLPEFSLERAGD